MTSVNSLTQAQCVAAIQEELRKKSFPTFNPHLTQVEINNLRLEIPIWPDAPVFSPLVPAGHDYTQKRINGVKYYLHAIAYRAHTGKLIPHDNDTSDQVSHRRWITATHTCRSFNPVDLTVEAGETNRSR